MPPAVVVRRKAFVKNGRGAGQSSAGACCESQNQANLGFAGQQRGRDVGVGQLPAVDVRLVKPLSRWWGFSTRMCSRQPRKSLSIVKPVHSRGMAGARRSPSRSGRSPRMPSTQPTMTVEAVPVSQCTWERPACGCSPCRGSSGCGSARGPCPPATRRRTRNRRCRRPAGRDSAPAGRTG